MKENVNKLKVSLSSAVYIKERSLEINWLSWSYLFGVIILFFLTFFVVAAHKACPTREKWWKWQKRNLFLRKFIRYNPRGNINLTMQHCTVSYLIGRRSSIGFFIREKRRMVKKIVLYFWHRSAGRKNGMFVIIEKLV